MKRREFLRGMLSGTAAAMLGVTPLRLGEEVIHDNTVSATAESTLTMEALAEALKELLPEFTEHFMTWHPLLTREST